MSRLVSSPRKFTCPRGNVEGLSRREKEGVREREGTQDEIKRYTGGTRRNCAREKSKSHKNYLYDLRATQFSVQFLARSPSLINKSRVLTAKVRPMERLPRRYARRWPRFGDFTPKAKAKKESARFRPPGFAGNLPHLWETLARYEHGDIKRYAEGIRSLRRKITAPARPGAILNSRRRSSALKPSLAPGSIESAADISFLDEYLPRPRGYVAAV